MKTEVFQSVAPDEFSKFADILSAALYNILKIFFKNSILY